jgi:exopolysaccharide biosynthesis polyprenyl glycosylphosphotransferase
MLISSWKYFLAILGITASTWGSLTHHLALTMTIAALAAGVMMATVAIERTSPQELTDRDEDSDISRRTSNRIRTLVIGADTVGRQLAEELEATGRYAVVGFIEDDEPGEIEGRWSVVGRRATTIEVIREHRVQEVFLAHAPTWQQRLADELAGSCPHVGVSIVPSPYEALLQIGNVESLGDIALVRMSTETRRPSDGIKRGLDILGALMGLVLLSPLLLLVGILIKLTSPGSAIFAQERVGRFGRSFLIYKFRTMMKNAEEATGPVLSSGKKDARLTALGRWLRLFRIDELPQLWNVLRGEMSLVGPRPERPCFVENYERMMPSYARRHQVRPGITGLAQICGGYHTKARDKLRFDLIYVSHRSFWLDSSILLRTILVVVMPNRK